MNKQPKSRNAIASFVKTIGPQVVPDKREKKSQRARRRSLERLTSYA